jgi:hypothetical protein
MRYSVTFCVQDREAGSNPMWHSCMLLSKMDDTLKMLEVVDNWGFYGLPSTSDGGSYMKRLKVWIGLDVDLYGNHGMLRHEKTRELDLGLGLHGATFELTRTQFELLQTKCRDMAAGQDSAIREVVEPQGIIGKPAGRARIYPHEKFSPLIKQLEDIKAEQQGREFRGFDTSQSRNCKSQILELLSSVLSKRQIARLTEDGAHPTIPKWSGSLETMHLHSSGPLREHQKASGEIVYFRDGEDPAVKLHWTIPPQEFECHLVETSQLLTIDKQYRSEVKAVVRKLQGLEWFLHNAVVPIEHQQLKEDLIQQVIKYYKAFSIIEPKTEAPKMSGITGFVYSLFSLPKNKEQKDLRVKINNAKSLFNSLYFAIADGWSLEEERIEPAGEDEKESLVKSVAVREVVPVEAVATVLSPKDQEKLCKLLGYRYCKPDPIDEDDEDEEVIESAQMF